MIKTFPINFIQEALEQTLLKAHIENPDFFGGRNQISLTSFYQQLKNEEEVNRFIETFRDLSEQQNRLNLIGNGILLSPENPTITNLYSCTIIPMTFTCAIRCQLSNRDQMIETINNLIEELKGTKCDIAQLKCRDSNGNVFYQPFMVGTIGHNERHPLVNNGDFIGTANGTIEVENILHDMADKDLYDIDFLFHEGQWYYAESYGKLVVFYCDGNNFVQIEDDGTHPEIIFPPEHESFEKFKLSMALESIRCDTPYTLNSEEYCEISFGGSATLVSENVKLGNDLVKVIINKKKIITETPIVFTNPTKYYLEPLEMPSGSNANTKVAQLVSNRFLNNSHTDALSITLQYTFVLDESIDLLKQWFKYGRYGTQYVGNASEHVQTMSPNLIYDIKEYWSSWGNVDVEPIIAKIVGSVDIENTEGDTLTLGVTMQVQGENN